MSTTPQDPYSPNPTGADRQPDRTWDAPTPYSQPAGSGWNDPWAPPSPVSPGVTSPTGATPPPGVTPPSVPAASPSAPQPRQRKGPGWFGVTAIAAVVAIAASTGTAALTGAFDQADAPAAPASTSQIGQSGSGAASVPASDSQTTNPDWQTVATAVAPAVVSIQVSSQQGTAEGSGVIVDDQAHIVTNYHVVADATNGEVDVTLLDGSIYQGTVIGTDETTDLAVVQLQNPPANLTWAQFADSSTVEVGQPVMAVGNPLGLSNTVTTGIVSALNRPVETSSSESYDAETVVTNAIQIDAAINPGNSGGPLFDASGKVIGITSSIATLSKGSSSQSGSIGLGFAIPSNLVSNVAGQLIDSGTAEHAFLGVQLIDGSAQADGVQRQGAEVYSVVDGSPAAEAGLQQGDVVVQIDGHTVSGKESLTAYVRSYTAGATVNLTVVRSGQSLQVPVTLAARKDS